MSVKDTLPSADGHFPTMSSLGEAQPGQINPLVPCRDTSCYYSLCNHYVRGLLGGGEHNTQLMTCLTGENAAQCLQI